VSKPVSKPVGSHPLRVAVVGLGIGEAHVQAYKLLPERFELTALCDLDAARAAAAAAALGGLPYYTSLGELLENSDAELIDLCTPPHLHFAQVQAVLARGWHVICEKPLVGSLREVDALATLEAASGCRVFPIFQYRFGHGLQKLKSLVDQGVTGRAFTTTVETAWRRRADYYQVPWRGKWASELGGALISHALHAHDMLSYILGPVRRVAAFTATRVNPIEVEDCASVSLELADGSLASLTVTLGSAAEISRHRFCFENLVAESGIDPYRSSSEPWTFTPDTAEQAVRVEKTLARFSPQPEGYEGQFYRVYEALRRGAPAPVTLHDARTALELATAIYEAAETGTVVSLPLNEQHPRYATWQPASLRKPGQNLGQRPGQNLGSTKTEAW